MAVNLSQKDRVVFVQMGLDSSRGAFHPHDTVISFNIAYSATILKNKGYEVDVLDNRLQNLPEHGLVKALVNTRALIFFIQVNTLQAQEAMALARAIKKDLPKGTCVIALGQHATALPETILTPDHCIDYCIRGESEGIVVDLVRSVQDDNNKDLLPLKGLAYFDDTKGTVVKNPPEDDLDDLDGLPFIDYGLFDIKGYKKHSARIRHYGALRWGFLLSSRGCHHQCNFCSPFLRHSFGRRFRAQSAERTVDEMVYLSREFRINAFSFEDDNFTLDRQRILDLCKKIKKRRLRFRWVAQVCMEYLDEELVYKMRECGCDTLRSGVESGSQRVLGELNKPLEIWHVRKIVPVIKKAGISLTLFFMLNNPSETYSDMQETFRLACELDPAMMHVYFCTPYPGSLLYERLREKNSEGSFCSHFAGVSWKLNDVPKKDIEAFQRQFYKRFYLRGRFLLNYFLNRGRYHLWRADEWRLIMDALKYLYVRNGGL